MAVPDPASGPRSVLRSDRAHATVHLVILLALTGLLAAAAAATSCLWLWEQALRTGR